jgi:hypothetical protein
LRKEKDGKNTSDRCHLNPPKQFGLLSQNIDRSKGLNVKTEFFLNVRSTSGNAVRTFFLVGVISFYWPRFVDSDQVPSLQTLYALLLGEGGGCLRKDEVLPTNFKNFLLDQPTNSAAGEKIRPHIKLTHKGKFCSFSMVHDPKR